MAKLHIMKIDGKYNKKITTKKLKGKSIPRTFFNEFLNQSSIHGFNHLSDSRRQVVEYIIWFALISAAVFFTVTLSYSTLKRYRENPTVISIEKDHFSFNTSFPGITLCPEFKFNEEHFEKFLRDSTAKNKTQLREFLLSLAKSNYKNFDSVIDFESDAILPAEYLQRLLELRYEYKFDVSNSGTHTKSLKSETVITEMGICYTFNSKLAMYNTPNYWYQSSWKVSDKDTIFYVNVCDGEITANVANISTSYDLYIHGPYEVADIASKSIHSPNGYFLQVYLTGLTLFSSERVRDLGVNQRKCRFHDESDLRHSPVYSYVLCRMECRAALAKRICGCIPHFYRMLDGDKVCDVKGLHCLANHKDRLILLKGECNCLANCDEVNYIVEDLDTREWFLGSNLQWGLKEYPKMRLRRDVIFGFSDLLVYIGGMAGLFLGCSVLSFIEIIYFFSIRLYWYVIKYKKEQRI